MNDWIEITPKTDFGGYKNILFYDKDTKYLYVGKYRKRQKDYRLDVLEHLKIESLVYMFTHYMVIELPRS